MVPGRRSAAQGGALSRRDPLSLFRNQLDALFDHFFGPMTFPAGQEEFGSNWGMDVEENDREVVVRVEMPGFEPDDIDVRVNDDTLSIQAEHRSRAPASQQGQQVPQGKEGQQQESGGWYRSFRRTITLPANLDTSKVEATYRHGLLEIRLPRSERARPRRIEVRTEGKTGERSAQPSQQAGTAPQQQAGSTPPVGQGNGAGKTAQAEGPRAEAAGGAGKESKTRSEPAGAGK
jgi:HSP20 family protein